MIELSFRKRLNASSGEMLLDIGLNIQDKSFLTLYGRSGAGKTSALKVLAGLLAPDEGYIRVNDTTWTDTGKKISLPPGKRRVGFVFQDYALFPNMTIRENLLFALNGKQNKSMVGEAIEIMELGELEDRKPHTLSGGQKQRLALARALVQRPDILLLDEPLSALDSELRKKLQQYIIRAHREYSLTTIMISHDVSDILTMSDKVVILEEGKIVRQGPPEGIFANKEVSGKFQFTGKIARIERQGFIFILTVLIGENLVKVVAEEEEANGLNLGDKVLVASKAFNPVISKIRG